MRVLLMLLLALPPVYAAPAMTAQSDPELAAGVRQVEEGDFEGAIVTLDPVARRLAAAGGAPAAQACLYLGIAQLALGQREAALARFREALAHQPSLRLTPDRYSPKVISAFEEARRTREAEAQPTPATSSATKSGGKGRGRTVLITGAALAAGVGAALALGGRHSQSGSGPEVAFMAARFGTPVLECPNDTSGTPLPVTIDLNAQNGSGNDVAITAASVVLIIVSSPAVPGEVGFAGTAPALVAPATVRPGSNALRVSTTLNCANGAGDASRFNEWKGRVTLTTASGAQTIETADTMRVNLP